MARTLLGKLKRGLFMTHTEFLEKAGEAFRRTGPVEPANLDRLEEALIASDAGVELSLRLVDALRQQIRTGRITTAEELRPAVREQLLALLRSTIDNQFGSEAAGKPRVTLLVGVNGTGKTTTAAKLAKRKQEGGSTVVLAAADTFRAAAVEQLKVWAERVATPVVHQQEGADPAAVVFDAIASARSKNTDEVLVDTAGRLHTKINLMEELKKIKRSMAKIMPDAPHEVLLVLDATTGQNALSQAKLFNEALGVTGIALAKLDGTAKGGIVISIHDRLNIPLQYVGVGETIEDLQVFDPHRFVDALFT